MLEKEKIDNGTGIIVGRFQVDELHEGHCDIFDYVMSLHNNVVVFLGLSEIKYTKNNPLDFEMRKNMILEKYPTVAVYYIEDVGNDELWSKMLDSLIAKQIPQNQNIIIYGSRDSFINSYCGHYKTEEFTPKNIISGTVIRRRVASNNIVKDVNFRRGVILATNNRYPTAFPTVDVAIIDDNNNLYLAQKRNQNKLRFVGGFTDPKRHNSFEHDARREALAETSMTVDINPQKDYIGSVKINDWRYRCEEDKIITNFYLARKVDGKPQAQDDIDSLSIIPISVFIEKYNELLVDEHIVLGKMLVDFFRNNK